MRAPLSLGLPALLAAGLLTPLLLAQPNPPPPRQVYAQRLRQVTSVPGLAAFWDFVRREDASPSARFTAHQPAGQAHPFALDVENYVLSFWQEGKPATYQDFPLLGRGPFGQAVRFQPQSDPTFRPMFLVPRARLHDTPLDVKGPGASVSMVVWLARESSTHAIAGIWHEGTDLHSLSPGIKRVEKGMRQYALFAGLAANPGASAAHVSENGAASFSDKYARNLSVTPDTIPTISPQAEPEEIDANWNTIGFVFNNQRNEVTSYRNGVAQEFWVENPGLHPFYKWAAKGWQQADRVRRQLPPSAEDAAYPPAQLYAPPEGKPLRIQRLSAAADQRVELHYFPYTKVRVTWRQQGKQWVVVNRELASLRVNPFYFPHDLYRPATPADGGPFTIGEFIHSSRSQGFIGYLGGVAVYRRALSQLEMRRLGQVGLSAPPLRLADLSPTAAKP